MCIVCIGIVCISIVWYCVVLCGIVCIVYTCSDKHRDMTGTEVCQSLISLLLCLVTMDTLGRVSLYMGCIGVCIEVIGVYRGI